MSVENRLHAIEHQLQVISHKQDKLLTVLAEVLRQEKIMAADLTQLEAQVKANTDAEASAVTLLTQLSDMLKSAQNDPAKVQAIADSLKSSATALAAAIVANTPAAPGASASPPRRNP
jgi:chromosome segregation ATPase